MNRLGVFVTILSALFAASTAIAPLLSSSSSKIIEGEYIVVFKREASTDQVGLHKKIVSTMLSNASTITHHYEIGSEFRGYAAKMTHEEMTKIRALPHVKYVEKNKVVEISEEQASVCMYQKQAPWGLVRTTWSSWPPTSYDYHFGSDGEGVQVYVIDSGIEVTHPDFQGRASWGIDLVQSPSARPYTDENGHGTHVTGTIIGLTYGVAKKATAIAVRVFDATGKGSSILTLYAINWVVNNFNSAKPTIINMSLGGGASTSEDDAVRAAIYRGIHFAVAAGNDAADACSQSPARVYEAVTVGASDINDNLASFSNYGQCVDIIGPGEYIESDYIGGTTKTLSGTSMATPHVAGVMAKILSKNPNYTPAQLKQYLLATATSDKVYGLTGSKWQTPNKLLYHHCSS